MSRLYAAAMTVEGADGYEAEDEQTYYANIQTMINQGAWALQGSFGRTMMDAIESGKCLLGQTSCRDYWGSYIPSRGEILCGHKGSREFVVAKMGEDWAKVMEEVA